MEGHTKCKDLESHGDSENADHYAKKKRKGNINENNCSCNHTEKKDLGGIQRGYLLLTTRDKSLIHEKANGKKQDAHCT